MHRRQSPPFSSEFRPDVNTLEGYYTSLVLATDKLELNREEINTGWKSCRQDNLQAEMETDLARNYNTSDQTGWEDYMWLPPEVKTGSEPGKAVKITNKFALKWLY